MRFVTAMCCMFLIISCSSRDASTQSRKSALAGSWYPAEADKLTSGIDKLLAGARGPEVKDPLILILPHAGYYYSGSVAARGYDSIRNMKPGVIVIMGPNHRYPLKGCSILDVASYETPLGRVPLNRDMVKQLLRDDNFTTLARAHEGEHSIEIHLPFIQRVFARELSNGVGIVPILVGDITDDEAGDIARAIETALGDAINPLIIISSDFTHYGTNFGFVPFKGDKPEVVQKKIKDLDYGALNTITQGNSANFADYVKDTGITVCGKNPIRTALNLNITGREAQILAYNTSGNITSDFKNCVSYAAVAVSGRLVPVKDKASRSGSVPTEAEKRFLLAQARRSIDEYLATGKKDPGSESSVPAYCTLQRGVFVTLKKDGDLRGCIGYPQPVTSLYQAVHENALNAAFRDPRFSPVQHHEMKDITIEISVLTLPEPVQSVDEIEVGRHGLIIERAGSRGLLLPQVPLEFGWDRTTYLRQLCRKAGLSSDAWKQEGTKLYRFEAIVFSEK